MKNTTRQKNDKTNKNGKLKKNMTKNKKDKTTKNKQKI